MAITKLNASVDLLNDVDTTTAAPADKEVLAWDSSTSQWEPLENNFVEEAPTSGLVYGRANGTWVEVTGGEGGGGTGGAGSVNLAYDKLTPDGVAVTFDLTIAGDAREPLGATNLLVSVNGVIQEPGVAFTTSDATITFSEVPQTDDVIDFIVELTNGSHWELNGVNLEYAGEGTKVIVDQFQANGDAIFMEKVGVGTDDPKEKLHVIGKVLASSYTLPPDNAGAFGILGASRMETFDLETQKELAFYADNTLVASMKDNGSAYFNGPVGIGMTPVTSTFDLSAKEQLKEWKTKAKKAPWTVVTDGAFEQEPTEELIAEWMETRAAGDALQVAGNISATGTVSADGVSARSIYRPNVDGGGIRFSTSNQVLPANNAGEPTNGVTSLGKSEGKFKDAHFSGAVNAGTVVANGPSNVGAPTNDIDPAILVDGGNTGAGEGGEVRFTSFDRTSGFAAIKGYVIDASPLSVGWLDFYTRANNAETDMALRMRIDAAGSVGIGTGSGPVGAPLHVKGASPDGVGGYLRLQNETSSTGYTGVYFGADATYAKQAIYGRRSQPNGGGSLIFAVDSNFDAADVAITDEKMILDAVGRLGIGGSPSTRSTKEIEDEAVATLANWDSKDKKPTKAELIKSLTERNIGGGDAKLQVAGSAYIKGTGDTLTLEKSSGAYLTYRDATGTVNASISARTTALGGSDYGLVFGVGPAQTARMAINDAGRVDITGSLYVNGQAKIGTKELIETLSTLRKATMDETQDIRESLRSAIDELISGFEHEIATMPAPEPAPEVSTMPTGDES